MGRGGRTFGDCTKLAVGPVRWGQRGLMGLWGNQCETTEGKRIKRAGCV